VSRPVVLVASRFLLSQRAAWDLGYELLGPGAIEAGLTADVAARVEVIVSDGDVLDSTLVKSLPRLRLVACFSTGYAGIDLGLLRSRGITLTSAAGANAHDVADHAIALMLAWWHGISGADRNVRDGKWRDQLTPRPSLRGKRVGVVGLGRIGVEIAQRAEALGLSVDWWGPREKPGTRYSRAASLLALARNSDVLIVAVRAVAGNAGTINGEVLRELGSEGLLVNISRGFVVDEAALLQALESQTIAGAALDVFAREPPDPLVWERFDNVVLSPHIGGYTEEAGVAMFGQLGENIRRYFAGEALLTPVEDAL
jgi:lactate dehydrogenase-like 2-hydroxyacid dehydrogenase